LLAVTMAGLAAKELKALIEVGTSLDYVGDELKSSLMTRG